MKKLDESARATKPPNPDGKHGKPFSLAPLSFDDAVRKILAAPPEPKLEKKQKKKQVRLKRL